tara:strand:+ start:5883 stop:6563 length:681 start_codon:yes stop_codon:yes gene_type:complete
MNRFSNFYRSVIFPSFSLTIVFLFACSSEPVDENTYMKQAREHYDAHYHLGAIEEYGKALELNSELIDAYEYRGRSNHELTRFEDAINDYTKAISMNDKNDLFFELRSTSYLELSMDMYNNRSEEYYGSTIDDANKAIELNPNNDQAYYNIGRVHLEMKKYNDATASFDKALELNPAHGKAQEYKVMINRLLNPVTDTDTGYEIDFSKFESESDNKSKSNVISSSE